MAASKFSTYDTSSSQPRKVDEQIRNIDPTDTPWQTMSGSGATDVKLFEWIEEALPASSTSNAQIEGFDAPTASHAEVTYRTNQVQTMARTAKITGFLDESNLYGRKKEYARLIGLQSTALKIDLEKTLVGLAARAVTVGSDAAARLFANPANMVNSGMIMDNDASPRALSETIILDASDLLYTAGIKASVLMVKPSDTRIIATFAAATGRTRDLEDGNKIVNSVQVYEGPVQTLKVVKNRHLLSSTAWVIDPDMWELVWFRKWRMQDVPSTGDWKAKFIFGDVAPKHKHFGASVLVTDLS